MNIKRYTRRSQTAQDAKWLQDHARRVLDDPEYSVTTRELAAVRRDQEWRGKRVRVQQ